MPNEFKGKKVLIMGLGLHGGGVGTAKFLMRAGAKVTITDLRSKKILSPSIKALSRYKGIKYVLGRHRGEDILKADLIVKNPGISPNSPFIRLAMAKKKPITSDMGIFFKRFPGKIIGVTGTRGKSTTAYLIWRFLKTRHSRTYLGGNIRKSVLELLPKLQRDDIVVLELSSFQLKDLSADKVSPQIAVLTNILRDHLNWHKNLPDYINSKKNVFLFQKKSDVLFVNFYDRVASRMAKQAPGRVIYPKLPKSFKLVVDSNLGAHFKNSVALANAVAGYFGVTQKNTIKILKNFHGLPERQQKIAAIKGVDFIDDTTATSPDAAVAALNRFGKGKKGKLILIAGGQDKKLDFSSFIRAIKSYADAVIFLPGSATDKLKKQVANRPDGKAIEDPRQNRDKWQMAVSMQDAVKKAWKVAQRGDIVLLSPGAASFGLFLNEFDRGKKFVDAVRKLK